MKDITKLSLPALLLAAFCLPAIAQEEQGLLAEDTTAAAPARPAAKPAAKRTAAKKKAAKKKKAEPVSEYKFSAVETVATYKFDKKANPIIKQAKKKKTPKKTAKKAAPAATAAPARGTPPAGKLTPRKHIGEEEAQEGQQPPQGAQGQQQKPEGGE